MELGWGAASRCGSEAAEVTVPTAAATDRTSASTAPTSPRSPSADPMAAADPGLQCTGVPAANDRRVRSPPLRTDGAYCLTRGAMHMRCACLLRPRERHGG